MTNAPKPQNERQAHWQGVYTTKGADTVSWHQPSPEPSLAMIDRSGIQPPDRVIDVGGGASSLVDRLSDRGFQVTVLDIADAALTVARDRLGSRAEAVDWQVSDITQWAPIGLYDLWHDRAVFHFLTTEQDRAAYLTALNTVLKVGGWAVLATFADDGPERCSGLPVRRYSAADLATELGPGFRLVDQAREQHRTPGGSEQLFTWTLFQRVT